MSGYISEVDYDGGAASNFVEVVIPAGTDVSSYSLVIYDTDGTVIETFSFDPPIQTIAGQDVYLFDDTYANWVDIHNNEAIALVDDTGSVLQFIAFKDPVTAVEGPADGQSATQIGEHSGGDQSLVTSDGGTSYSTTTTATPGSVPCFGEGTLIETTEGPRAVQDLRAGDEVLTADGGPQPIRWCSKTHVVIDGDSAEGAVPILIKANAIAPGTPSRDLILSPNHRVVLGGFGQFDCLLAGQAFAPAKAFTGLPGVRPMRGCKDITWHHFALEGHAVVEANGLKVESLLLGTMVLNRLSRFEARLLHRKYPRRRDRSPLNGPPARPILSLSQAQGLLKLRDICGLFHPPAPDNAFQRRAS